MLPKRLRKSLDQYTHSIAPSWMTAMLTPGTRRSDMRWAKESGGVP